MPARMTLAFFVALAALPVRGAEPEALLPATSQFYVRWDGIRSHQAAYDRSARGQMFTGDTGRAVVAVKQFLLDRLHDSVTGDALSRGQTPEQLIQLNADCKELAGLFPLLITATILAGGRDRPASFECIFQKVGRTTIRNAAELRRRNYIYDHAGAARWDHMAAAVRFAGQERVTFKTLSPDGRAVTLQPRKRSFQVAAWTEGEHRRR